MGNSDHGTTYMKVEGDDGELRLSCVSVSVGVNESTGNPN